MNKEASITDLKNLFIHFYTGDTQIGQQKMGWKDVSVLMSTDYSSRGQGFSSQHSCDGSQLLPGMQVVCRHACRQNACTHKKN